ncbi:MAG: prepilin-type N-terminal cleavage/methylation domain-containing protein [Candidatus Saccharimonadales bacterium]
MGKGKGFTVIEVMIFLTISGLLLIMAFVGAGGMARQARFSDSVNSFQSLILKQYEEVLSGVNTRAAADGCGGVSASPGSGGCILLGKVITWKTSSASPQGKLWHVTTSNMSVPDTGDIYTQLAAAGPTMSVVGTTTETFELAWGASFQEASRSTDKLGSGPIKTGSSPNRALINAIAFLRSPNSSQVIPYYFYTTDYNDATTITTDLKTAVNATGYLLASRSSAGQVTAAVCIMNDKDWATGSPVAAVLFGSGSGSSAITTEFEPLRTGATAICS